jgi:S-adenosylmethionine:tRNA ribosyltransferase-isomerase
MWSGIYAHGRPIQYSYLSEAQPLWSVQTVYASRPWAVEMPSAGYSLTWKTLLELKKRGVRLARVTHAAGLSSTGHENIDAMLPFPEHFEIPPETVDAVALARRAGGRVIAIGTTVVRALEGSVALKGCLAAGEGYTDLVIDRSFQRQIVDGFLPACTIRRKVTFGCCEHLPMNTFFAAAGGTLPQLATCVMSSATSA